MIVLTRTEQTDRGTIGYISINGIEICRTLELPDMNNEKNVSCIPVGEYPILFEYSARYGVNLWELKEVPGRSEIKIHSGNFLHESNGCIFPGRYLGYDQNGDRRTYDSIKALNLFHNEMKSKTRDIIRIRKV